MLDFPGVSALLIILVLFVWLARRTRRLSRRIFRWPGVGVSVLLAVVTTVILGAVLIGYWKLNRTYDNPVSQVTVAGTPEQVARGARFEPYCSGCHSAGPGKPLTGHDFLGEGAPPIGTLYAPNLTPVQLGDWSDGEIIRAIREGIHRNGRSLMIMPASLLHNLSDDDAKAIVAWLRSLPPQGGKTPTNRLNVLGAAMVNLADVFEARPPITEPVTAPPPGPTAGYGAYLASLTCELCHGKRLQGDAAFGAPGLTFVPAAWEKEEFVHFIRTGTRPNGSSVDGDRMPWKDLSRFLSEDDDVRAVYAHLEEVAER